MITFFHQYMNIESFDFFWILSLISWTNTFKTQEFRPNIENSHPHTKFLPHIHPDKVLFIPPFIHPRNSRILIFLWILSLISWANTFKTQEFKPKIENSHQHRKFCTIFILIILYKHIP